MLNTNIDIVLSASGRRQPAVQPGGVRLTSAGRGWNGITVEVQRHRPHEMQPHYCQGHGLMLQIGAPARFEWQDDGRWRRLRLTPGDIYLLGHGEPNSPRWQDPMTVLAVVLDDAFVQGAFADSAGARPLTVRPLRGERDPVIEHFAGRFAAELRQPRYDGALYGESLALAFTQHLLTAHSAAVKPLVRPRGRLTTLQMRRVCDYVHSHLSDELSLSELAEQLHLSTYHFARLFKKSFGRSPHQYVLQLRIDRARQLLRTAGRGLNLTEIGVAVGFYDHAHFTNTFKRSVGVTPKRFVEQN